MKFYMLRNDLGEKLVPGYTLEMAEEEALGNEWFVTRYVYKHDATGIFCMASLHWNEETGSEPEDFIEGRCFYKNGEELVELTEAYQKEVIRYEWAKVAE